MALISFKKSAREPLARWATSPERWERSDRIAPPGVKAHNQYFICRHRLLFDLQQAQLWYSSCAEYDL